eukprot:SAG31_NODE_17233_length_678_cov_1.203800_1_plen_100_part_01
MSPSDCTATTKGIAPAALYKRIVAPVFRGDEANRMGCAYALASLAAAGDGQALEMLLSALKQTESESGRRAASHALTAAGPGAVSSLLDLLHNAVAGADW